MEQQRITIKDIAEELGLSTATVSNVIHGKTKKVSDETVKRVQALLEERQYIPSMAGILLAQNSSKIIGIFINDHEKYEGHTLDDVFIASSLNALSTEIEKNGQFMMVKKAKNPQEIIQFASMWNMDGLIVLGFCEQDYLYLRNHMRIPFVVYDVFCKEPKRFINMNIDNYSGGFQIGTHFRQTGHQKVLCLSDNETGVDKERWDGFSAGFLHGHETTAFADFLLIPMKKEERSQFYLHHLPLFQSVTAIFAVSDYYAIDLIRFLTSQKIRVPEDISVAGFDDIPMCEMVWPSLTTVRQDNTQRARLAISKLQELKEGTNEGEEILLPVSLIVRESTR